MANHRISMESGNYKGSEFLCLGGCWAVGHNGQILMRDMRMQGWPGDLTNSLVWE